MSTPQQASSSSIQDGTASPLHLHGGSQVLRALNRRSLRRSRTISAQAGPSDSGGSGHPAYTNVLSSAARRRIERIGWERSQKRTYTKWLNYHLRTHPHRVVPPIVDIDKDLCDGVRLCALIEVLLHNGKASTDRSTLPKVWNPVNLPKDKFKALENACIFIQAFQSLFPAAKMNSLGPQDIVDGNYTLIMGLLWKMILVVQMDVNDMNALSSEDPDQEIVPPAALSAEQKQLLRAEDSETGRLADGQGAAEGNDSTGPDTTTTTTERPGTGRRKAGERPRVRTLAFAQTNLLEWVQERIQSYDLDVSNFTDCFADGRVFQALVASIDGDYRYDRETTQDPHHNMTSAFNHLDHRLDIPQLLSPDDMVGACSPDQRSVMTYLSIIHSKYKDAPIVRHSRHLQSDASSASSAPETSDGTTKRRKKTANGDDNNDDDDDDDDDEEEELNLHIALKGRGLKTGIVGTHNVFVISVLNNVTGEIIPSGDALFVELVNTERKEHMLVYRQSSNPDGSSVYSYIPTVHDRQLSLSVWHYDSLVTALTIDVEAPPPPAEGAAEEERPPMLELSSAGLKDSIFIGEPTQFKVLGLSQLSLDDIAQHLSIVVDGPHSQLSVTSSVAAAEGSSEKTLIAGFVAVEIGQHHVYLYYQGHLQHQSRVEAILPAPPGLLIDPTTGVPFLPDDELADREQATDYHVHLLIGTEAHFDVTVKNSGANETRFRVVGPDGIVIVPAVVWHGEDEFTISYTPPVEGEYVLETFSGAQRQRLQPVFASHRARLSTPPTPASPREASSSSSLTPGASSTTLPRTSYDKTTTTTQRVSLHAVMAEETKIMLHDPSSTASPWSTVVANCESEVQTQLLDPCGEVVEHTIEQGVLIFEPKLPGKHVFQFQRPEAVQFEVMHVINVSLPDPVFIHFPSLRCIVGLEATFTVALRSAPGIPTPTGDLEIYIDGPQGRIPSTVEIVDEGYLCCYIPDTPGEFIIRVFLDGNEIRKCSVFAVATDVGKTIHLGQVCRVDIEMRMAGLPEVSSDPSVDSPTSVRVSVNAPSGENIPAILEQSPVDGICSLTFLPREPGVYMLSCMYQQVETPMPAILAVPASCPLPDDEPAPQRTLPKRVPRRMAALRSSHRMSQTFNARSSVRRLGASPAAIFEPAPQPPVPSIALPQTSPSSSASSLPDASIDEPQPTSPREILEYSHRTRGITTPLSRPATGSEIRPVPVVQTSQSFRLWLGSERLEKRLGLEDAFKTFSLSRTLTTEELRQQMIEILCKGRPPELVREVQHIISEDAYCICEQPLYGDESTCRRLFRTEIIKEVITRMRQTENQIKTVSSLSRKMSEKKVQKQLDRCSGMITQENAKFLATQAHRLYVNVHEILALDSSVTTLACSASMNAQKYRTETMRVENGVVRFNSDMTFGTNSLHKEVLTLRITEATLQREVGSVQIPLDQLLVAPTWDTVFPLAGLRQGHSTMAGSARVTLKYVPNETVPKIKLSKSQIDAFCRSQPCRLLVSVVQVEDMPTNTTELLDIYFRASFNRQFRKSALRRASTCPQWAGERLPFGVAHVLPDEHLRISFQAKKKKERELARVTVPLEQLQRNFELIGWFPLTDASGSSIPGRALVSVEYLVEGAWSTETLGRLYFRPAPKFYLQINVVYPRQRMKVGERLRIQVKVRDLQNNRALTDDLQGGELEIKVQTPSGAVLFLPVHKDYPDPEEGLFFIDLVPREVGTYTSMLKYNDQDMQHRFCQIKVRGSRQRQSVFQVSIN